MKLSLIEGIQYQVPRERHQNGWVVESGLRVKKWIGHWRPYRPDGTRGHSTTVLGLKSKMRKWEAEEALRAHIDKELKQKTEFPSGEPTLASFWDRAYLPSRTWGLAMKSAVTSVVKHHVLPRFGSRRLSDIDKLELQQHLNELAGAYSQSVVKKVRVQLRALFEEAVDQDLIAKSPARKLKMPRTRKPCGRFLTLEEFGRLIAQLDFRDQLIVRMACSMGFRAGELFALRRDDVEENRIRVDESASPFGLKEPKNESSAAYVPTPPSIRRDLKRWLQMKGPAQPTEFVFPTSNGGPIPYHRFERDVLVPAAIRAGIMAEPDEERTKGDPKRDKATAVNFQALRRTCGTWSQRTGASVKDTQGILRHASPDQTLKAYMKEIPEGVRTTVDALDDMFCKAGRRPNKKSVPRTRI